MFSFSDTNPAILEHDIDWGEAQEKYPDSYMIATNFHVEITGLRGDIIAILTPEKYLTLEDKPKPMAPKYGGLEAKTYRFRIERLELHEKIKGSSNAIVLENITTHLIDGDEPEFLIGWNVLKYLKTTYTPALPFDLSQQDSDMVISNYYHLELTKEGRILLEYDRHLQFNNDLKEMFEY